MVKGHEQDAAKNVEKIKGFESKNSLNLRSVGGLEANALPPADSKKAESTMQAYDGNNPFSISGG